MALDDKSTYYDAGGIETINIIAAKLTKEQYMGYLLGNVIKYSTRINWKSPDSMLRDAEKIETYSKLLREAVEIQCKFPECGCVCKTNCKDFPE